MNVQEYIQSKLDELSRPLGLKEIKDKEELEAEIFRLLMSKKFRKYSVNPEYQKHIRSAVSINIAKNEPIKLTFPFGGYKLWRLEEFPEADWAELFTLIYYSSWLKPICSVYPPGIWLDFFADDVIVPRLNNVSAEDTKAYGPSFKNILKFLKPYLLTNMEITLTRVIDQYESVEAFESDLANKVKTTQEALGGGLPELNDKAKATVELNVRATDEQLADPNWREKVKLIHDAYLQVDKKRPYFRVPEKILIFSSPITDCLAVGTTKRTIAKFWCGVGALAKQDNNYHTLVLSPSQVEKTDFDTEKVEIPGLTGKNFHSIRIIEK